MRSGGIMGFQGSELNSNGSGEIRWNWVKIVWNFMGVNGIKLDFIGLFGISGKIR